MFSFTHLPFMNLKLLLSPNIKHLRIADSILVTTDFRCSRDLLYIQRIQYLQEIYRFSKVSVHLTANLEEKKFTDKFHMSRKKRH